MNGRTALITGGGSGIGRALARELARRGAIVTVTDIDGDAAARVASELGGDAASAALDVRDLDAVRAAVDGVVARHGRLDVMINNAGIGVAGEAQEFAPGHWQRIIDVNITGVVNGVQAAYPLMVRQRSGHLVNVASLAGVGVAPFLVPYAMSKYAVVGLSTSLRIEAAAHGVHVSVLCPAAIETPLLDCGNPADLPPISWAPNIRRYLTRLSGPPYPADRFAREALDAIARNDGVVVLPKRARLAWRLGRFLPNVVERSVAAIARRERGER
ncbi:MAG TPA: SDR family oxidoreductase [Thermoanaerobaculia bacterium]|nr:SDR family oxidoreductase [Thermoanaerobaculia bacterium]